MQDRLEVDGRRTAGTTTNGRGPVSAPLRVVLADDDAEIRFLLAKMLNDSGVFETVGSAGDGRDLLAAAGSTEPDVVLFDQVMPYLDVPTVAALRSTVPSAALVVLSGMPKSHSASGPLTPFVDGYIEKGAGIGRLVSDLQAIAVSSGPVSSNVDLRDDDVLTIGELARRLHDETVQCLTAALWSLERHDASDDANERAQLLRSVRRAVGNCLDSVQRISAAGQRNAER